MQVFKVDDSLAVRLPKAVVDELGLKEGDDAVAVQKAATRAEFLRQMEQFRCPLPDGYRFESDEANER